MKYETSGNSRLCTYLHEQKKMNIMQQVKKKLENYNKML